MGTAGATGIESRNCSAPVRVKFTGWSAEPGRSIFSLHAFFMSHIHAGRNPINSMTNSALLLKQPRGRLSVDEGHP